jgi:hypothetical protein
MALSKEPVWVTRGKTIRELIEELSTFEDQELEIRISVDDGELRKPISLVKKSQGHCLLVYCGKDRD